ncbi:MAG: type II toxin-antitoxin system VapC family toxin [Deltaproteobacteria bacterium]|nr:type II toxin-antitoxin system VapC family toxin [Deltaproteobacteria bacterium]
MNPVLLDTHVFVWALAAPERLPAEAWPILRDESRPLRLSVASAWELSIKVGLGKIQLPTGISRFVSEGCRQLEAQLLPIGLAHLERLASLPMHHRDPFDRMIVAQARTDGLQLLSFDAALQAYDVDFAA